MSLTTVAELRTALGIGTLYADAVLQSVCDASDDVLLPFIWNNTSFNVAVESTATTATLYFDYIIRDNFYVGQTVVVDGNEAHINGSHTITAVEDYSITYTINNGVVRPKHKLNPYGSVAGSTALDPADVPAIQEASLMISVAIWQARQAPTGQGVSIDGYAPSPYTMSNQLMARVRGLLAPYLSPNSMVG
jgi:hypothetical protein